MAMRTRRRVPVMEIGLMPIPESGRTRLPSDARNSMRRRTASEPCSHSIPEYTSSVFSRKITTSICSGFRTGEGVPRK